MASYHCFLGLLLLCAELAASSPSEKVVYDNDDRMDVYQLPSDDQWVELTKQSIVALVSASSLGSPDSDGVYRRLERDEYNGITLQTSRGLCDSERFLNHPTFAGCSGTLIGEDRVITAGHCMDGRTDCDDKMFLFNYYATGEYEDGFPMFPEITEDDVYSCRRAYVYDDGQKDIAIVQLDRPVPSWRHTPAPINTVAEAVTVGQQLAIIGFGSGIPAKIDVGGAVTNARAHALDYFMASTDSFGGNSGSGVFDMDGVQVGVLVRGATDYVTGPEGCTIVNVITGCTTNCGESLTYAFHGPADSPECSQDSDCPDNQICSTTCGSGVDECSGFCQDAYDFPNHVAGSITCGETFTGSTNSASDNFGNASPDVVLAVTLPEGSVSQEFDSCSSNYDTFLRVFTEDAPVAACDDCGSCGSKTILSTELGAGEYYLVVEGYGTNSGNFAVTLNCEIESPTPEPTEEGCPEDAISLRAFAQALKENTDTSMYSLCSA